jgi:cell division septation protein DedD
MLSTRPSADSAAESFTQDPPPAAFEAHAPLSAQFDDVLALPDARDEAATHDAASDYVLEDMFVPASAPPAPALYGAPEPSEALAVAPAVAAADTEQQPSQVFAAAAASAADSSRPAPQPAPVPDGYAVGLRVIRIAPVWLLLSSVGFLSILMLLSWASQPIPQAVAVAAQSPAQARSNEASNSASLKAQAPALPAERPAEPAPAAQAQMAQQPAPAAVAPVQPAQAAPQPASQPVSQPASQPAAEPAAPQALPAPAPQKPSGGGKFAVQVGSYKDVSEANARVSALRAAGFEAEAVAAEIPGRGLWHRVICGRAKTREEAAGLGAQLRAKGAVREVMITELK